MPGPLENFKQRKPSNIQPSRKVRNNVSGKDVPPGDDKRLPIWAKWVIGVNLIMVHLIVMLTGIEDIPFMLNDVALAAYIVTVLGIPIGLASQAVRNALAVVFGVKT